MYDVIIIGSGPAGLTAGIYSTRREMKTLIIGKELGGQLIWASGIENYPGFEQIGSFELIEKMSNQATKLGAEIKNMEVLEIKKEADTSFTIKTASGSFKSKTLIIAMGLSPRRLAVPGEKELNGKGVSYCANCDGPLYKGKIVAVIGAGNAALDAAEILSKIAAKVYLINRGHDFKAFNVLVKTVEARENIEILLDAETKEIVGENKVEKINLINRLSNETREVKVDGVFIEIGRIATTDIIADLVERNEQQQIIINSHAETKTPGMFAAGDVTNTEIKQITVAVGQGTVAALNAYQYLQLKADKRL